MQTNSQLIHHNQAIIPPSVLEALKLREGDSIVFEIDSGRRSFT
jgi:antitoxin component of MazEF toxin-antitoxin module